MAQFSALIQMKDGYTTDSHCLSWECTFWTWEQKDNAVAAHLHHRGSSWRHGPHSPASWLHLCCLLLPSAAAAAAVVYHPCMELAAPLCSSLLLVSLASGLGSVGCRKLGTGGQICNNCSEDRCNGEIGLMYSTVEPCCRTDPVNTATLLLQPLIKSSGQPQVTI